MTRNKNKPLNLLAGSIVSRRARRALRFHYPALISGQPLAQEYRAEARIICKALHLVERDTWPLTLGYFRISVPLVPVPKVTQ